MALPYCSNTDIENHLSPLSLVGLSTGDWLVSAGERWACQHAEFSLRVVRLGPGTCVSVLLWGCSLNWLGQPCTMYNVKIYKIATVFTIMCTPWLRQC